MIMRIKEGYVLRKVADSGVIVSLEEMDCNHLMTLNQSGMDLWEMLQSDCNMEMLVQGMSELYDVEKDVLYSDILSFIEKIREAGLLDG